MAGLAAGMYSGKACGTLTGAAALLATYAGKSEDNEEPNVICNLMVNELVEWFEKAFGSTECSALVSEDFNERMVVCTELIKKTFQKCMDILVSRGFDPYNDEG